MPLAEDVGQKEMITLSMGLFTTKKEKDGSMVYFRDGKQVCVCGAGVEPIAFLDHPPDEKLPDQLLGTIKLVSGSPDNYIRVGDTIKPQVDCCCDGDCMKYEYFWNDPETGEWTSFHGVAPEGIKLTAQHRLRYFYVKCTCDCHCECLQSDPVGPVYPKTYETGDPWHLDEVWEDHYKRPIKEEG